MPVNLSAPENLLPIPGIRLGIARAGVRKPGRKDLVVMTLPETATVAGVFTRNRYCAAPVTICRKVLASGQPVRALVINTGCANAGTGRQGHDDALVVCSAVAEAVGCNTDQVLPFSTGVILERLPVDRIVAGLPACIDDLDEDRWVSAAEAIMTTDTVPKGVSRTFEIDGQICRVTGIAKGSGMIHPNMATMLGYVAVDVAVPQPLLQALLQEVADASFNRVTVDGDTSTNDAFVLVAAGGAGRPRVDRAEGAAWAALRAAVLEVSVLLAQALARDGEGATKFVTIEIEGGRDRGECLQVGKAIAHSPLIKTALFASDPNLGRLLAAIGYAGIEDLDVDGISLWLGELRVIRDGQPDPDYTEAEAAAVMKAPEITIRVDLGRGTARDHVWTCDFSYDYVRINAEYRS
ncbi:MAG: bifunctional glutamate N-acetyltransferase/amino-acid acetyltransferase ArgJ [Halothiobacillaceae bacterium]